MRCQGPSPSSYWMVRAPGPAWAQKEQLNVTAQLTHAANDPRLRPLQPARRRLLAWLSGQLCVQSLWRNKRFLSCEGSLTGFYRVVFEALGCISAKTMWFQEPLAPVVAEANEHAIAMIILRSSESPRTTRNDNTRQPAGLCSQHVAHVHPPPTRTVGSLPPRDLAAVPPARDPFGFHRGSRNDPTWRSRARSWCSWCSWCWAGRKEVVSGVVWGIEKATF